MKININKTIKTNLINKETNFSIKDSPIAYKLLSDNLYKYPLKSMIRELLCNAFDSQYRAGMPYTPIKVFCGCVTHPILMIRDYGTGMSEKEIKKVYTSYFTSTKNKTNKEMGGYGLGSKSPLAYTHTQFLITSYYNGIKSSYIVYLNDKGVPCLNKIESPTPTDEQNGLEVSVPISIDDVEIIKYLITELVCVSKMRVNFVDSSFNTELIECVDRAYILNTESFFYVDRHPACPMYNNLGEEVTDYIYFMVGEVMYNIEAKHYLAYDEFEKLLPIILKKIPRKLNVTLDFIHDLFTNKIQLNLLISRFLALKPVFNIKIGSIDILPSREGVELSDRTYNEIYATILATLIICYKTFYNNVSEVVNDKKNRDDTKRIFEKDTILSYVILNCGHIHISDLPIWVSLYGDFLFIKGLNVFTSIKDANVKTYYNSYFLNNYKINMTLLGVDYIYSDKSWVKRFRPNFNVFALNEKYQKNGMPRNEIEGKAVLVFGYDNENCYRKLKDDKMPFDEHYFESKYISFSDLKLRESIKKERRKYNYTLYSNLLMPLDDKTFNISEYVSKGKYVFVLPKFECCKTEQLRKFIRDAIDKIHGDENFIMLFINQNKLNKFIAEVDNKNIIPITKYDNNKYSNMFKKIIKHSKSINLYFESVSTNSYLYYCIASYRDSVIRAINIIRQSTLVSNKNIAKETYNDFVEWFTGHTPEQSNCSIYKLLNLYQMKKRIIILNYLVDYGEIYNYTSEEKTIIMNLLLSTLNNLEEKEI